jgi:hypothetical protein
MEPDTLAYVAVMREIKHRTSLVYALLDKQLTVMYETTHVETMVLQVRMITELIALGSLAAHRGIFEEQQRKFDKHWDPVKILKDVERINPDFYPKPIIELPSTQHGIKAHLVDRPDGYLTQAELIEVHGRCGNVLHARNPYGAPLDHALYEGLVGGWMERIMALLNTHQIRLLDERTFHLVQMRDKGSDDVRMYTFGRAPTDLSTAQARDGDA